MTYILVLGLSFSLVLHVVFIELLLGLSHRVEVLTRQVNDLENETYDDCK